MDALAITAPSAVQISTDAAIIATIGLMVVYGIVAGQLMLARLAASFYVGLVLAAYATAPLHEAIGTSSLGGFDVTKSFVQLGLLVLPVVLLQFGHHQVHGRHKADFVQALVMGVLTAFLAATAVFIQLDDVTRQNLLDGSLVASYLYSLKLVWLVAAPIAIVLFHFLHARAERTAHRKR